MKTENPIPWVAFHTPLCTGKFLPTKLENRLVPVKADISSLISTVPSSAGESTVQMFRERSGNRGKTKGLILTSDRSQARVNLLEPMGLI